MMSCFAIAQLLIIFNTLDLQFGLADDDYYYDSEQSGWGDYYFPDYYDPWLNLACPPY